jgi:hypothetical protein
MDAEQLVEDYINDNPSYGTSPNWIGKRLGCANSVTYPAVQRLVLEIKNILTIYVK